MVELIVANIAVECHHSRADDTGGHIAPTLRKLQGQCCFCTYLVVFFQSETQPME